MAISIGDFAQIIGVELEVRSRYRSAGKLAHTTMDALWYANLEHAETVEDGVAIGTYGDGPTPEAAIKAYCQAISGKRISIYIGPGERREFGVPNLFYGEEGDSCSASESG